MQPDESIPGVHEPGVVVVKQPWEHTLGRGRGLYPAQESIFCNQMEWAEFTFVNLSLI